MSERIPIGNISGENLRGVLSSFGDVTEVSATALGKAVKIDGKIAITLIACEINDDGSAGYIPMKHSFDFQENVNISGQISDNSAVRCSVLLPLVEALIDGDEMEVKCSLSVSVCVNEALDVERLDSLTVMSEMNDSSASVVTVYYPKEGDTLFSVAKKYHKSLSAVAEVNSLTDAVSVSDIKTSPIGVKKLFIM